MVRLPVRMMSYRRNSAENEKWCCGVVVIITAQLHSTKLELKFCAGSNPALVACQRFEMLRISDNGPSWK